jgi:type I restriction enzyme, S subunit
VGLVEDKMRGQAYPAINDSEFALLPFPLPPLAEQHRIVAKIDELFALCDRLEAARAKREVTRNRLTAASFAPLNNPDLETFGDGTRFALDAFSVLTAREHQIKSLRQCILNLAVHGMLVPQESRDEPASDLLRRIREERKLSTGSAVDERGNDRKAGDRSSVTLPMGWSFASLQEVAEIGTGLTPSRSNPEFYKGGTIPWINSASTNHSFIRRAEQFVTQRAVKECRLKIYPAGSLVIALYGQGKTRGQVAELGIDATVNQACAVVQWLPSFGELKDYVRLTLEQQYESIRRRAEGGPQPNLNVRKIKELSFPLPPLKEQHHIAAKVNALIAICDRLEASLAATDKTRSRLLDALLAEALAPVEQRELEAAE